MIVKKRKIKKQVFYVLIGIIVIVIGVCLFVKGCKKRQTTEYKLGKIGYSTQEIEEILKLDNKYVACILKSDYSEIKYKLIEQKYFIDTNIEEYIAYYEKHKDMDLDTIIAIVNVGQNDKVYDTYDVANPEDESLILVNKHSKLDESATFDDLVEVKNWYCYGNNTLRQEAYDNYVDLFNAAKEDGFSLFISSSYRSYTDQEDTWNNLGGDKEDTSISMPGFSDYQTGLAVDILNVKEGTDAFKWLDKNAYKYGFILRYPKDKTYLTGFDYSENHFRYVGIKAAKVIHDENITFDEYYAYYVKNK